MDSEDKSATTNPPGKHLGGPPGKPPGVPPGEPPGGAGALESVELECEVVFKADIHSPTHFGPVELKTEKKSVTTAVVQTETAAAEVQVLRVGVVQ